MAIRTGQAIWQGDLKSGKGTIKLGSGACEVQYSYSSRFEEGKGTNPEELIGAAHAGCFSMALSHALSEAGFAPKKIETAARVHFQPGESGFRITQIELHTEVWVPDIENAKFQTIAEIAKQNCPVSKALAAIEIKLDAHLLGEAAKTGH